MRHPFDRLERPRLAAATTAFAVAFLLLTALLLYAVPAEDRSRIQELLAAGSPEAARALLAAWPAATFESFSFLLGFDLLYDIVHNNAVALFAVLGARRLRARSGDVAASLTAWVMWLDTGLNLFENLAFLHIIRSLEPLPLLPIAAPVFSFRTLTLIAGLLVGIALHLLAWRRRS